MEISDLDPDETEGFIGWSEALGPARASGLKSQLNQKYAESTQLDFRYFLNTFRISQEFF